MKPWMLAFVMVASLGCGEVETRSFTPFEVPATLEEAEDFDDVDISEHEERMSGYAGCRASIVCVFFLPIMGIEWLARDEWFIAKIRADGSVMELKYDEEGTLIEGVVERPEAAYRIESFEMTKPRIITIVARKPEGETEFVPYGFEEADEFMKADYRAQLASSNSWSMGALLSETMATNARLHEWGIDQIQKGALDEGEAARGFFRETCLSSWERDQEAVDDILRTVADRPVVLERLGHEPVDCFEERHVGAPEFERFANQAITSCDDIVETFEGPAGEAERAATCDSKSFWDRIRTGECWIERDIDESDVALCERVYEQLRELDPSLPGLPGDSSK